MVKKLDDKISQIRLDADAEIKRENRAYIDNISTLREGVYTEIQNLLKQTDKKIADYNKAGDWAFAMAVIVGACSVLGVYAYGMAYINQMLTTILLVSASVIMPAGMIIKFVTNNKASKIQQYSEDAKTKILSGLSGQEVHLKKACQKQIDYIREKANLQIEKQYRLLAGRGVVPNKKFGGVYSDKLADAKIKLNERSRALSIVQELIEAKSQKEINKIFAKYPNLTADQKTYLFELMNNDKKYNELMAKTTEIQEWVQHAEDSVARKHTEMLDEFKKESPRKYARIAKKNKNR